MTKVIIILTTLLSLSCLSDTQKAKAARDMYYDEMHQCVEDYNTRVEIDKCRKDVREKWGK